MAVVRNSFAGNGVVQETRLEFQVILPGGRMHADVQGRFLFTRHRALLIARRVKGKLWLMPHTPYSSPQSFCPVQRTFFLAARCPYIMQPRRGSRRVLLCGKDMAPRTDYGYCSGHAGKLLGACMPSQG